MDHALFNFLVLSIMNNKIEEENDSHCSINEVQCVYIHVRRSIVAYNVLSTCDCLVHNKL